jgi:hypothetical protein
MRPRVETPSDVRSALDRPAPDGGSGVLRGATRLVETPLGAVLVTVNEASPGEPVEVLVRAGKAGSDLAGFAEAIARLCSICLRLPSPISGSARLRLIADELAGIGGARRAPDASAARSLPDAVARALADAGRRPRSARTPMCCAEILAASDRLRRQICIDQNHNSSRLAPRAA